MPRPPQITREQALAFRAEGHGLRERRPAADLLEVAGACGVRNTPPGSMLPGLGARLEGLTPDALDAALGDERSLVEVLSIRISPLIVPAREIATFVLGALPAEDASLAAVLRSHAGPLEAAGLTPVGALKLSVSAAHSELQDGPLSRSDLSAAITARLPEPLRVWCRACKSNHLPESLFRLVGVAGAFVLVRDGKATRYTRTDQWLGSQVNGDAAAARADLLRRYLRCFGPSTPGDFASWVGIGAGEGRHDFERCADSLAEVQLEGKRAFVHADNLAQLEDPPRMTGARLLPAYDAYLDQRDRLTLLPEKGLHQQIWRILGNPGAVLADGEVAGVWRSQKKGKRLIVTVEAFAALSERSRAEVEGEAERLATLRGCTSAEVAYSG